MAGNMIATAGNATGPTGEAAYRNTQGRVLIAGLMRVAQSLWGKKATENLADRSGVSPRSVEPWEQNKGTLSAVALANIIRSEEGWKFLESLMENHQPRWWRLITPLMELAEVQQMQIAARRRTRKIIRGLADADQDLSAALARADAISISDPEFMRAHSDALRSTAGVQRGPMVTRKQK